MAPPASLARKLSVDETPSSKPKKNKKGRKARRSSSFSFFSRRKYSASKQEFSDDTELPQENYEEAINTHVVTNYDVTPDTHLSEIPGMLDETSDAFDNSDCYREEDVAQSPFGVSCDELMMLDIEGISTESGIEWLEKSEELSEWHCLPYIDKESNYSECIEDEDDDDVGHESEAEAKQDAESQDLSEGGAAVGEGGDSEAEGTPDIHSSVHFPQHESTPRPSGENKIHFEEASTSGIGGSNHVTFNFHGFFPELTKGLSRGSSCRSIVSGSGQLFTIDEEGTNINEGVAKSSLPGDFDNEDSDHRNPATCSQESIEEGQPVHVDTPMPKSTAQMRTHHSTSSQLPINRWSIAGSTFDTADNYWVNRQGRSTFWEAGTSSIPHLPSSSSPGDQEAAGSDGEARNDGDDFEESDEGCGADAAHSSPDVTDDAQSADFDPVGSSTTTLDDDHGLRTQSMMDLSVMSTSMMELSLGSLRGGVPKDVLKRSSSIDTRDQVKEPKSNLRRSASLNFSFRSSSENLENFKQRLLRKREQWRERRQSSKSLKDAIRRDSKEDPPKETAKPSEENPPSTPDSKLYRWFSLRKSVNYDVERRSSTIANAERTSSYTATTNGASTISTNHRMPKLLEEGDADHGGLFSENGGVFAHTFQRRHQPPALPAMPQGLSPEQIKRRHIVANIVHSENNYVATLQRLVNDYKKPLGDSKPPILNTAKLATLFHRVSEILQCHTLFRIALAECVRQWDREEKIGDVFVASFSKAIVLDIYSDFINNFTRAMEVAKQESKKKTAFADFLKMRQITSPDRLSFFGLMVKPVQRFPQFILFLQDLLKHTPQGHHDRMSLQLALTQLESLAEMLNERKREAEQYQAFRDTLKHINTKFALRGIQEGNRYLLRQDDVMQLEFNQNGLISKSKARRLFLTNDLIICVTVVPKSNDEYGHQNERLSLKWAVPVTDVEIQDTSSSPTLSRLLASGVTKSGTISVARIPEETMGSNVDNLCQEMNNLMHDYEIISRISSLVSSLRGSYDGLTSENLQQISSSIQRALHIRDEQMAWVDACCLQFTVKTKEGREKETYTFQTDNPVIKKDWIVELRLAQLALDIANSPAWDVPEQEKRPSTKMPLFVKALPVFSSPHETEVKCGCCYNITSSRPSRISGIGRHQTYLWLCSSDGVSSHVTIYLMQQVGLREVVRVDMVEVCVTSLQHVPGITTTSDEPSLRAHTVWMGTHSHKLLVYSGLDPEKQTELGSATVPAAVTTIKYHCDQVYVGLCNGIVQVYRRGADGAWQLREPNDICLGTYSVTALLPINTHVYAACGEQVHVIDCFTAEVTKKFSVHHEGAGEVQLMAHSGIGLWIAQKNTATICLYHTETFRHLQDINVASNVSRVLGERGPSPANVKVTALLASRGLLWVGTNVGVALTIPLPRLEGVPIISGRANISYHAHSGPITFLLTLHPHSRPQATLPELRPASRPSLQDSHTQSQETSRPSSNTDDTQSFMSTPTPGSRLEKQQSDGSLVPTRRVPPRLRQQLSSPVILRRKPRESHQQHVRRLSKTLPRGLGLGALAGSQECDVYGLYGDLLNVHEYEDDEPLNIGEGLLLSRYDSLRRSDPELAVPAQVSTLDRRVRLKASRPRSLDLSTWSMDSRASSACTTTSSGSEDGSGLGIGSTTVTATPLEATSNSSSSGNTTSGRATTSRRKENDQSRTLMTLMGGRGYINLRQTLDAQPPHTNEKDAHIVVWEMKL